MDATNSVGHLITGCIKGVGYSGTQNSEYGNDDECDQRNQQTILDQRLSFFFYDEALDHDYSFNSNLPETGGYGKGFCVMSRSLNEIANFMSEICDLNTVSLDTFPVIPHFQ